LDHLLERAQTPEDLLAVQATIDAVGSAVEYHLSRSPFLYRKVGDSPFLRELIVPFGRAGYVALFEIVDSTTVSVAAIRHQLEDDYH
jgi:hypothetical protein